MDTRLLLNPATKEKRQLIAHPGQAGGAYSIAEAELAPGGGNGLHYHRGLTQTFTCLRGELFIHLGGKRMLGLRVGEKYTVHPGEVHALFNPTVTAVCYTVRTTPGHAGHEQMKHILGCLAREGLVKENGLPKDFNTLALLMVLGDTYFTSVPSFFRPWILWKAKQAHRKGLYEKLVNRYCKQPT